MIRLSLIGDEDVRERLGAIPAAAGPIMIRAVSDFADRVRAKAEENLSGRLLNTRTGRLRDSLATEVTSDGSQIAAFIRAGAPYAAFQEFGFTGVESVRAYLRRQSEAFGRKVAPRSVQVRAHERHVDYQGRAYLRTALAETVPNLKDTLSSALTEVIRP